MKFFYIIIFSCFMIFSAAKSQEMGWVSIYSRPSGSTVHLDSAFIGTTPIHELQLPAGEHVVELAPPSTGSWVLTDQVRHIEVTPGDTTIVYVIFDKPIPVNSIPYGADVLVDSTLLGRTPLYLSYQLYKNKLLQLRKIGYVPYEVRVISEQPILVTLKPEANFVAKKRSRPHILGILPREKIKSKFALLALTVTTHWMAFYFKNVADTHYKRYLHTANPRLIKENWDKTRKYDRLSDISLGFSYISLAGLMYMVIWH